MSAGETEKLLWPAFCAGWVIGGGPKGGAPVFIRGPWNWLCCGDGEEKVGNRKNTAL